MSKKKYDFNGTLLNLLLLGGAAVILKNRTGSLRGVGGIRGKWITIENKIESPYIDWNILDKVTTFNSYEEARSYMNRMIAYQSSGRTDYKTGRKKYEVIDSFDSESTSVRYDDGIYNITLKYIS